MLFNAIKGGRGTGNLSDFADDFGRIALVLNTESNYTKTLPEFLDNVKKFNDLGEALGNQKAVNDTILGILSKTSKTGNVGRPQMSSIKGAAAEIIEISELGPDLIKQIQPFVPGGADRRLFREALCEGDYSGLKGEWYLEVKNYPRASKSSGVNHLKTQVTSHFRRAASEYVGSNVEEWPGLLYRFAAAGQDGVNFNAFEEAIKSQARLEVTEILEAAGDLTGPEIKARVEMFMTQVVVELV